MSILLPTDQPIYFPNVTATGDRLLGLIRYATGQCEGTLGANRSLSQQTYSTVIAVYPNSGEGQIPYLPIISITKVEIRRSYQMLDRRVVTTAWEEISSDYYQVEADGRILFKVLATEARITYVSGFDFTADTAEVQRIKAVAGVLVEYGEQRFYGALDSFLDNPAGDTDVKSYNYRDTRAFLETHLLPLRRYVPRPTV